MKIVVDRKEFNEVIAHVSRAVSSKTTIPALEGIMILTQEESIQLLSYNLEIGLFKTMEARILEPGEVIINAKLLCDIIRRLPGETVTLAVDEKHLCSIESGSAKFDILGMDTAEFPEMPSVSDANQMMLTGEMLKNMVQQTIFAVATTDAKPVHTGILFDSKEGRLHLVSVDGYRLAVREEIIPELPELHFIVPGSALQEAVHLISQEEEPVQLQISNRHIRFCIEGYTLIARLLEGNFIDYENTIPKTFQSIVRVNTRNMMDTVERISLVINERVKSPLRMNVSDESMRISCVSSMGRANDYCDANLEGLPVEIGFNYRFLLDALRASECDEVLLKFNGSLAPMIVKPTEGDSFTFMVMPMQLKNEG